MKKWIELLKKRKTAMTIAAIMVVFVTTYTLILPALTIEKDTAAEQAGIVLDQDAANEADAEAVTVEKDAAQSVQDTAQTDVAVTEEAAADTKADTKKAEKASEDTSAAVEETAEDADEIAMPEQKFEKELKEEGITVYVKAEEGALPEGTTMEVEAVDDQDVLDKISAEAEKKAAKDTTIGDIQAVDISFWNDGEEIEPAENVYVTIASDLIKDTEEQMIIHVNDEDSDKVAKNKQGKAEVVKPMTEKQLEKKDITPADDEIVFEADQFSVYGIVGTETITTEHIDHNGTKYEVTVTYGPDAKIPEGSTLRVTDIEDGTKAYDDARNAVLADKKEKNEFVDLEDFNLAALDISIIDPNGNEIEPEAAVTVDIKIKDLPGVDDLDEIKESLEIQHHVEVKDGVVVEKVFDGSVEGSYEMETDENIVKAGTVVDPDSVSEDDFKVEPSNEEDAIDASFETGVFSTFTITWRSGGRTVTVHYVDESGNELNVSNSGTGVFGNLNANSDSPAFLIYDIDGYEYSYTYRNTNNNNNRIAPLLTKNNNNRWQYMGANSTSTNELNNGDNIYVVYKKKADVSTGGTPSVDQTETWPDQEDPARKPQFGKSSTNNGNGTNNISLSITAPEKPVSKSTPADVIVVFDISRSMVDNNLGNVTRLQAAKDAVNTMANTLLNGQNSNVRMALITFSTSAQQVNITGATNGFTSSYTNFKSAVDGLSADGGTNWEKALELANQMQVRSDAATFVVFVTDGDPTFRVSRGNVTNGNLPNDMWTGSTYTYYRNNHVFGQGNDDDYDRNFDFAVEQVKKIVGANKNFYSIGISTSVTKVQNLTTQGGVDANHAFIASNTTAMENAFKSITEAIKSVLGFGNVEVTDGITALTNAEMKVMQTVDPTSFKYYRYGGENNKYGNGYANKTEWTTREADGCAAASYSSTDGAVHWDMGENFQLEDGVTYVVEFTVWPSQAAYDLVADLNNGLKTYASLTEAEKAQVVEVTAPTETTTGTYALKTNTDEVEATYNRTTKTGDTVSVSDTTDVTAEYHPGTLQNMSLDSDYITVKKEWHNALDSRVVDGITLTVTKDGAVYLDDVDLSGSNNWTSDEQYISAGFITTTSDGRYNVRETGHEYTVTEPASFSYYWDLTADTYRPMVIDGTLKLLIKTDNPTGTEGTDYFVIGGNKYQVSSTTNPQLTASNDRRSNLNLKKIVTANTQAVDKVPDPDDVFTYTITVTDTNGDDVWFGAQDESGAAVLIESYSANVTPEVDEDDNPTGSYSVPSGAQFTISIKAGWNVRFFNLPKGTTYSIQETGMEDGYEFVKAETSAEVTKPEYADDFQATPGTVSGDTVTGTIDQPNNVYSTEYTNNWNPNNEIVIIKNDENSTKLAGAQFKLSKLSGEEWTEIATFTSKADAGETLKVGHGLYKLEETTAPANYTMTDTVYFQVETRGNSTTVTLTNEDGEETTYSDAVASGNEVTIRDWPLTSAEATKAWKNADGSTTAPTGVSVVYTLYADGEATDYTVTLDGAADDTTPEAAGGYESEGWKATFVNLTKYKFVNGEPVEIEYTIAETTTYPGYTASTTDPVASGGTITNTQESTTANASKAWENADGTTDAPQGGQVTFTLYADGTATNYTVTLDGTVDTAPTGTAGFESEAWKAMFQNLPKYKIVNGEAVAIEYTIAETGTYPGYTPSTTDPVASGGTITNKQGSTETYAVKAWKSADGTETAPDGATVVFTLYADSTATTYTVTLDGTVDDEPTGTAGYEKEAWKATFVNLPKYQPGTTTEIVYTIAETTGYPGYTASTIDPVGSGSTITNSQDPTEANALKAWSNADGTKTAPQGGQVTYTLYADGTITEYTVTLDGTPDTAPEVTGGYESEAWKASFVNLPKYQPGTTTEIKYTIAETTTYPGYTASTTDPVDRGETITNTQEPTEANALKAWKNADGSTTPPDGATVEFTLFADETATEYKVTLDGTVDETVPTGTAGYESEAWKALFQNLPKYKVVEGAAVEIVYTVGESQGYAGYTATPAIPVASGETITNAQEDTNVNATKAWVNADGSTTAPEGGTVVFTLFADDEATDYTVTLDGTADEAPTVTAGYESEAWKASFVNLPKYKADGTTEIVYTIAETTGYTGYKASTTEPVVSGETITNSQLSAEIKLLKIGDGQTSTTLDNAEFELYSTWNGAGSASNVKAKNIYGEEVGTIRTTGGGLANIGKLLPGTYYLVETKAPDGYNMLTDPVVINIQLVDTDLGYTVTYNQKDYSQSMSGPLSPDTDGAYQITVSDPSGAALPHTGGSGTLPYTLGGLMLIIASALMYGFRMRRRERRLN